MTGGARRLAPLALTMGDPAGIGLEITLKAWRARAERGLHPFAVFADPNALSERARLLGLPTPIRVVDRLVDAAEVFTEALPVVTVPLASPARPGAPDSANAAAVLAAIEQATEAVARGEAAAIVTNPIAKSTLYAAGFTHPGHTEYLGALAARLYPGRRYHPVMMLASDELKVVPLTVHIPLAEVAKAISRPLIFDAARITREALARDFGIDNPRIAVAGLNPHAGEDGTIGREDEDIVRPAVRELEREGFAITGPHPADTLFHAAARRRYDAALCMYHDQALIPIKTLAFDTGVNMTLGLPFVRTSPDHGTAFDIADQGTARPESLIKALLSAAAMAEMRARASQKNPA